MPHPTINPFRSLWYLAALGLLAGVGYLVLWLTAPVDQVTMENYLLLAEKMHTGELHQADVETVLGGPPNGPSNGATMGQVELWSKTWRGQDLAIVVTFYETTSQACGLSYYRPDPAPQDSLATKLRRWLGIK